MSEWILLIAVDSIIDAYSIRADLEWNEIEVEIKNELTNQLTPGHSAAIGGIRILVKESQLEKAKEILNEMGHEKTQERKSNKYLSFFDSKTKAIPLIGKKSLIVRLFIFVTILLACIVIPFVLITSPTLEEKLTSKHWCIHNITYQGKPLVRETYPVSISFSNCLQPFNLENKGSIQMPLYRNCSQPTRWACKGDRITILCEDSSNSENDRNVLEGLYHVSLRGNHLELISDDVVIEATVWRVL